MSEIARESVPAGGGRSDGRPGGVWRAAAAGAVWVLLPVGLFFGAIFRSESFFERDLDWIDRPLRALLVRLWHEEGAIPLWNPFTNMGQEFAANPHNALFHPLSWLFLVLPWETAFRLQVIVPLVATALAMLFFLRTLGLGWPAAQIGALSWGFGGLALSLTNLLPMLLTIAPAPALAAFAVRAACDGGRRNVAGLAVCTALVCAGGEPVTILIAAVLAAAAPVIELGTVARPRGERPGRALAPFARLAAGAALGAAIAAVVLVPAMRLASRSERGSGLPASQALSWSLPPLRLAELAVPQAMGRVEVSDLSRYWGSSWYPTRRLPLVYSLYPGLLITALAVTRMFRPGRRLGWAVVAGLGTLVALGRHTPLWRAARVGLPGLDALRFPEKWVILVLFATVVLAADELDHRLDARGRHDRRLEGVLLAFASAMLILAAGVAAVGATAGSQAWRALGLSPQQAAAFAAAAPGRALTQLGFAVALLLAVRAVPRDRAGGALLLTAVLAADLLVAGRPLVPTLDPATAPDSALARAAASKCGSRRLLNLAGWQQSGKAAASAATLLIPAGWGIATAYDNDFDYTEPRWSRRATDLFWRSTNTEPELMAPLLARRDVGFVLQERETGGQRELQLAPVTRPRPNVACADRVVRFSGDAGWVAAVRQLGAGVRTAALAEDPDWPEAPEHPAPCSVADASLRPGRIAATVTGAGPGPSVVLIDQTWHPGWQLTVDGRRAVLHRVDLDLGAAVVPPGRHRIEMVYRDRWLTASLVVSCAALLLCAALALPLRLTAPRRAKGRGGP